MSTAESEYVALSELTRETIFQRGLLSELGYPQYHATTLWSDSAAAKSISEKAGFSQRSKSIRLAYHNVRYCQNEEKITKVCKVKGTNNPADIFTKALGAREIQRYCDCFFTNTKNYSEHQSKRQRLE